jgi:serine/threonine-protein kinase
MLLEPVFTEEKLHPPAGQDFIRNIPQTDTAGFVMNFIAPGKNGTPDIFKDSNKTMVDAEVNIAKEGDLRNDKPDAFLEKFSQLANGRMIRHLGSGGMADVYLVWHPRMEVYRAIKVIKPGQPTQWVQRFETELRIFANLNHPNIVQCYGVGEWYTLPYIEMEYVQGVSMEQVMKSDVGLTPVDVACIGILVCRALYYAHNEVVNLYGESYKGIIHRDLKPANILLSRSGHIKLTDFGIARPGAVSLHTSEAGKVVGTLPYLAPEQFKGEIITAKTDIYALGTTLFELATGKRGFPQQDIPTLITAKTRDCFKLQDRAPELPQPFAQIIERAMALDPADRFPSALQMGQCLELFLRSAFQNKETFILSGLVNRIFKPT